jgi:predicted AAA+ superfamily ATPase
LRRGLEKAETSTEIFDLFQHKRLIILDEAQNVSNIGLKLKLCIDTNPDIQIIASGSSSFELLQKSNEPLTGRKKEFHLFPLSFGELVQHDSLLTEMRLLEKRLIYGSYPEVINQPGNEREVLHEIVTSYLYKDLLKVEGIHKSSMLDKLLLALALQTGSEVSYNELANSIGNINSATVEKYIDLLEKAFVIFKLNALSRNLRNEIKKGKKIYFCDNGIRNTILNNFQPPGQRLDKGALWENYLIAERFKRNHYVHHYCNPYFWRTFDQAEVDYIEEYDGQLHLFEMKWKQQRKRMPESILTNYEIGSTSFLDSENFANFLS